MVRRIRPRRIIEKKIVNCRIWRNRVFVIALLLCAAIGVFDNWEQGVQKSSSEWQICVYNTETEALMTMELENYIVGVVAAEMPASFDLEALKAQAVAARTFAMNRMLHPNIKVTTVHPDAQITTSPNTCQAWINDETQQKRWGSAYEKWHNKIVKAVFETAGEVLYYDGTLIEPVYHASCGGGATEAAEDVWGTAKPYLVSVECNHPPDKHSKVITVVSMSELREKMNLHDIAVEAIMNMPERAISVIERTASNRIKLLRIGDQQFRGGELRNAFGLKSTLVDWSIDGNDIIFVTNGYGHGAGMCQHGADYYAQLGYDYQQILLHYYPGTMLVRI